MLFFAFLLLIGRTKYLYESKKSGAVKPLRELISYAQENRVSIRTPLTWAAHWFGCDR
jgi:hypothetical protein